MAGKSIRDSEEDARNEAAFEAVVRTQSGRLLRTARRILLHDEDARDAVQDAFLSAVRSIGQFKGEADLSTWLHRIVINAALLKLRANRRVRERPIEDLLPTFLPDGEHSEPIFAWIDPCEAGLIQQEIHDIVHAAIARLPDDYRVVLLLRDIEGLDTKEAAQLLEISADAAKTRLHRARRALRTLLDPHFRGHPL